MLQAATPSDLGRHPILQGLTDFRTSYPELKLCLFLSDRVADVFRYPVDVAIRYGPEMSTKPGAIHFSQTGMP
ncbi:hypothetical protein BTW07_16910 [Salinicola socius]|uniref:LysR substrate-binding domain-containing protein n=1 Tax=Salinicola socius TaxID=404433 RepID=A0A1Q8SNL1_9GAMM|nr:hypothetical protein BTW07_16910 [Salinicola socius]